MTQPIAFGGRMIGRGYPVAIIAEVGINHEGDADRCRRLIEAAAMAGADAVKLQTIDADENYVRGSPSHTLFRTAWLTPEETARMFELARSLGMEVFTTAGDAATLAWVDRLNPAAHKVSSGLLTNTPLIRSAAATRRTILISTGMATASEVDGAVEAARDGGSGIGVLQCTSLYPAPAEALNLAAIPWLAARYGVPAGFSDHSLGTEAAALAVAAGARMIEKHFTLDSQRAGYDHSISLEPNGFRDLVSRVRAAEAMLGSPGKAPAPGEGERARIMRRIVVARRDIAAGELLSWETVGLKRPNPGTIGLPPSDAESLLGRRTARAMRRDEPLLYDAIEPSP